MKRYVALMTAMILVILALPVFSSASSYTSGTTTGYNVAYSTNTSTGTSTNTSTGISTNTHITMRPGDGWNSTHTKYKLGGKWFKGLLFEKGKWHYLAPKLLTNKIKSFSSVEMLDIDPSTNHAGDNIVNDIKKVTKGQAVFKGENVEGYLYKVYYNSKKTIYANANGEIERYGWIKLSKATYYISGHTAVTGGYKIGNDVYYFAKDGKMKTGWLTMSKNTLNNKSTQSQTTSAVPYRLCSTEYGKAKKYYFDKATGKMLTGWQTINGKLYYFYPGEGTKTNVKQTYYGTKGGRANADRAPIIAGVTVTGSLFVNGYIETVNGDWYKVSSSGVCKKTTKPNYKWDYIR